MGNQSKALQPVVIEINLNMTDGEIIDKISYYLNNQAEFKKLQKNGFDWSQKYSQ